MGIRQVYIAKRRCGVGVAAVMLAMAVPMPAAACVYGKYAFKPGSSSQSAVMGLFRGTYEEDRDLKVSDWRQMAMADRDDATDTPGKLNYAWALFKGGEQAQAMALLQQVVQAEPENYEALCTYATVLHEMRQYAPARAALQKAVSLKPGFRNHAEELHLALVDYEEKSRMNPQYAGENLFYPPLTAIWKNRQGVEENFSKVKFPAEINSKGLAELIRQFPQKGDLWFALGMALENEKDFEYAVKSYDRALEHGTAHSQDLKSYMVTFRDFGQSQSPARVLGRRIVQLVIFLVGLGIAMVVFRFVGGIINDISNRRARKNEELRRERRKNKDPDAPL